MTIYIGADHRGYAMKEGLVAWLREQGNDVHDMGAKDYTEGDDYPDYAKAVAQEVAGDTQARGIVLCGSGVGVAVSANKVTGIRAAVIHDMNIAQAARNDDDINVLALGADYISLEDAKKVVTVFLETPFSGEERHVRRIGKIERI
jgi:ribose 5-phosphate isomerase B